MCGCVNTGEGGRGGGGACVCTRVNIGEGVHVWVCDHGRVAADLGEGCIGVSVSPHTYTLSITCSMRNLHPLTPTHPHPHTLSLTCSMRHLHPLTITHPHPPHTLSPAP